MLVLNSFIFCVIWFGFFFFDLYTYETSPIGACLCLIIIYCYYSLIICKYYLDGVADVLLIIFLFTEFGVLLILLIYNFVIVRFKYSSVVTKISPTFGYCYLLLLIFLWSPDLLDIFLGADDSIFLAGDACFKTDTVGALFFHFCFFEWTLINLYLCSGIFCCQLVYIVSKYYKDFFFSGGLKFKNFFYLKQSVNCRGIAYSYFYFC